jgi:hypothetical protein
MKTLSTSTESKQSQEVSNHPKVSTTVVQNELEAPQKDCSYAADYFDLKDLPSLILEPKLDVNNLVEKIVFLEDYLSDQLRNNKMSVDRDAFTSILSDIERTLGIDRKHELNHRVSRVYGFLNIVKKTKDSSEKRRNLLNKYFKR